MALRQSKEPALAAGTRYIFISSRVAFDYHRNADCHGETASPRRRFRWLFGCIPGSFIGYIDAVRVSGVSYV